MSETLTDGRDEIVEEIGQLALDFAIGDGEAQFFNPNELPLEPDALWKQANRQWPDDLVFVESDGKYVVIDLRKHRERQLFLAWTNPMDVWDSCADAWRIEAADSETYACAINEDIPPEKWMDGYGHLIAGSRCEPLAERRLRLYALAEQIRTISISTNATAPSPKALVESIDGIPSPEAWRTATILGALAAIASVSYENHAVTIMEARNKIGILAVVSSALMAGLPVTTYELEQVAEWQTYFSETKLFTESTSHGVATASATREQSFDGSMRGSIAQNIYQSDTRRRFRKFYAFKLGEFASKIKEASCPPVFLEARADVETFAPLLSAYKQLRSELYAIHSDIKSKGESYWNSVLKQRAEMKQWATGYQEREAEILQQVETVTRLPL